MDEPFERSWKRGSGRRHRRRHQGVMASCCPLHNLRPSQGPTSKARLSTPGPGQRGHGGVEQTHPGAMHCMSGDGPNICPEGRARCGRDKRHISAALGLGHQVAAPSHGRPHVAGAQRPRVLPAAEHPHLPKQHSLSVCSRACTRRS
jgi:hypothetical protein